MIEKVAGRLALTQETLLLSTAMSRFGGDEELGGVRVATLANIAVIEGTDPRRVVVGEGPRAAEEFSLKFGVIPRDYEVITSKIQYLVGPQVVAEQEVQLTDGRGELRLPFGFAFPQYIGQFAQPRLVINEDTKEQLVSRPKAWQTSEFDVGLVWGDKDVDPQTGVEPNDELLTADFPNVGVQAFSEEWERRATEGEDQTEIFRLVAWVPNPASATTRHQKGLASDGFYETVLEPGVVAGNKGEVVAKLDDVLLGRTTSVMVEPGLASTATITADRISYPGDETTQVLLTVEARDQYGNAVADGTIVVWEKIGYHEGRFVEKQEEIHQGKATARYIAGSLRPHSPRIKVYVDGSVGEIQLEQAFLQIEVFANPAELDFVNGQYNGPVELEAHVTSNAGPPADNAPIKWSATLGTIEVSQALTSGVAKARWFPQPGLPFRGGIQVMGSLGPSNGTQIIVVRSEPPDTTSSTFALAQIVSTRPTATVEPMVFAGDRTSDGVATVEGLDGATVEVPFKASAVYRLTGLEVGEQVTVRLGSNQHPNVEPVAHYTAEEGIFVEVVPEERGVHEGTTTGGVAIQDDGYRGLGFRFDGTGVIQVPHHEEFEFPSAFMVQAGVQPSSDLGAQTILDKAGDYRLELVDINDALHARFTVSTLTGEKSATSVVSVNRDAWTMISGRFESGRLWIGVDSTEVFVDIDDLPTHSPTALQIGPFYKGGIDEVRLFDLTWSSLSTFSNGQQTISFEADTSGEFQTQIFSTGQFGKPKGDLAASASFAAAQTEPPPSVSDSHLRVWFTETTAFFEDRGIEAKSWYGLAGFGLLAGVFKFVEGLWAGTGNDLDPIVLAGDLIGSIWLAPVSIVREVINAGERAVEMQANGTDAVIMSLFVIQVAAVFVKKKAAIVTKLGKLGRLLRAGGAANGTMARILTKEAQRTLFGIGDIQRVKKLAELAAVGFIAAQAVAGLVQGIGDQEESVDYLEAILSDAESPEELVAVLAEIQSTMPVDGFRHFLEAPIGEDDSNGELVAVVASAAPYRFFPPVHMVSSAPNVLPQIKKLFTMTTKAARGMERASNVLRSTFQPSAANSILRRLSYHFKGGAKGVFEELHQLSAFLTSKVGVNEGVVQLAKMVTRLGSKSFRARRGQRLVLSALIPRLSSASKVAVEELIKIPLRGGRKTVKRFYDFVITKATGQRIFYEVKNWSARNWSRIPPLKPPQGSQALFDAFHWAKEQWLRDIAQHGPAAARNLRWIFPKAFLNKFGDDLVREFEKLVKSGKLRQYMGAAGRNATREDVARYKDTIAALQGQVKKLLVTYP